MKLILDYLSGRKQRTKVHESFSSWRNIIHGVPQGSILGTLLFNIYINDFFLFRGILILQIMRMIALYEFSGSLQEVINKLEQDALCLIEWYQSNYLKPNSGKWHLLLNEKRDDITINIGNECIHNSQNEKLLGVYFDNELNFKTHVNKLCKKSGQKLHALARISNFMNLNERKMLSSRHSSVTVLSFRCVTAEVLIRVLIEFTNVHYASFIKIMIYPLILS